MGFFNVTVHRVRGAFIYQCGMVVDADGAHNAYRLDNQGLDDLQNAKNDAGDWVGAVTVDGKKTSAPVELSDGSLVSPTSLHDPTYGVKDERRYVDASTKPYLAICPELMALGVKLGDLAVVLRKDMLVGLINADVCPHHHYGECSMAAAPGVGLSGSPRNGGCDTGCTYVVFAGTATDPPWPRAVVEYQQAAMNAFDAWGGRAGLLAMGLVL